MEQKTSKKLILREITLAWLIVILASRLAHSFRGFSIIEQNLSLITAVLLLYVPILIHIKKKERVAYLDASWRKIIEAFFYFAAASLIIFPFATIGNHFYQQLFWGESYHSSAPFEWGKFFLFEIAVVSFPEEFFFRGYLQGRLNQIFGKPWKCLGTAIGPGLPLISLVFAISHSLIQVQWWHLFIFFPSFVFGWLKERTGNITAPLLFHALSNVFSQWVILHY